MTHAPPIQPGQAWTQELIAAFVARHAIDVSAEMIRLAAEMREAFRQGRLWPCRLLADALVRSNPTRTLDAQLLTFVQPRPAVGAIHAATVHVVFDTGEVVVRGWPLEEGSRWVV